MAERGAYETARRVLQLTKRIFKWAIGRGFVTTITASKQLPEIASVERLGLLANEAGPVAVYGVGFSTLQNPAAALRVTGATPTAVSVLSDRMMSVTFPALPADSHALTLTNAAGIPTRNKSISVLDPVTLGTVRTRSLGGSQYTAFPELPLAITGDNVLWIKRGSTWNGLLAYDLERSAPKTVLDPNASYTFYDGPWGLVSPNGQRLIMTQSAGISSRPPMLYRDAADGQVGSYRDTGNFTFFYRGSSDRQGQSWILDLEEVRGFDLGIKGLIELPANWHGSQRVISRDGTRLYAYALHGSAIGTYSEPNPIVYWPRVYVFDISTPPTQTGSYPLIGQIDLADYPACRATQGPVGCSPYGTWLTITDDDRSLIAVGDRNLVVVPVPANLRSH